MYQAYYIEQLRKYVVKVVNDAPEKGWMQFGEHRYFDMEIAAIAYIEEIRERFPDAEIEMDIDW